MDVQTRVHAKKDETRRTNDMYKVPWSDNRHYRTFYLLAGGKIAETTNQDGFLAADQGNFLKRPPIIGGFINLGRQSGTIGPTFHPAVH